MKKLQILSISMLVFLVACGQSNEVEVKTNVLKIGEDEVVESKAIFIGGLKEGTEYVREVNGKYRKEISWLSGELHGTMRTFDSFGHLSLESTYLKGKKNGSENEYYSNGNLKSNMFYKNDTAFGPSYEYYSNGMAKSFAYLDSQGNVQFLVEYEESGRLLNVDGNILIDLVASAYKLDLGDTFELDFKIPQSPATTSKYSGKVLGPDSNDYILNEPRPLHFEFTPSQKGKFVLNLSGELLTDDSTYVYSESIDFVVE